MVHIVFEKKALKIEELLIPDEQLIKRFPDENVISKYNQLFSK